MSKHLPAPLVGLVEDMPNHEYHRLPSMSKSRLFEMTVPANYYGKFLDPGRPTPQETVGQRSGTLLHTLVLEPHSFAERYAVGPEATRSTKEWKAFESSQGDGVTCIKPSELDQSERMARSLRKHPELNELLEDGRPEVSAFWTDPTTGLACRCRVDWLHDAGRGWIVLDLKTGPADPRNFGLQAARMGYDIQAAFYSDGLEAATGKPVLAFLFGNVEHTSPFLSSCMQIPDEAQDSARRKYRRLLASYAECTRTNTWPGYEGVQLAEFPRYAIEEA